MFLLFIRPFLERKNIIITLFAIFMSAFFWTNDSKGHRLIFILLLALPFLILHGKNIFLANKTISLYLSWAILFLLCCSVFWSDIESYKEADKSFINILSAYLILQIAYFCFAHEKWQWAINAFSFTAVIVISLSVFQFYQEHSFPNDRFASTIRELHPNITANYMVLALVFFIFKINQSVSLISFKNLAFIFCIIFLGLCVLLTHSRGAILTLFVSLSMLTLLKKPKLFFSLILMSLLITLIYWLVEPVIFEQLFLRGSAGRSKIYQILLERVVGNEILGLGLIADETIYFSPTFTSGHTHDIYLASYFHLGLVGLLLHLSILFASICYGFKIYKANGNWLPLVWLTLGSTSLLTEGTLFIRPYHIEWVQFWLPVSFAAAQYHRLKIS